MKRPAVWTAILLAGLLGAVALLPEAGRAGDKEGHPVVEKGALCIECHEEVTPEVVHRWFDGLHGMNNVKCFVCHGSTGDDFTASPGTDGCIGCHDEFVESMNDSFMAGKDCFSCHPPHLLSPHAMKTEKGGAR